MRNAATSAAGWKQETNAMKNSTKSAVALALVLAAIMVVASGINYNSPADAAALPFAGSPGSATPVRENKADRLDAGAKIRRIAGVTLVLRDFGRVVR